MLSFLKDKSLCTGCGACYSACPVSCIEMQKDVEGFLYPVASNRCIDCGVCQKVCPQLSSPLHKKDVSQTAYAACSNEYDVWKRSASGGAFSEICRAFGDDETMFVGAVWDGLTVRHDFVFGYTNIAPLCKSKYVASDIGDAFKKVKQHLQTGKKAVFCGTPCQVAGLKSYLKIDYENLLLIDFVCHGVGSERVFSSCISLMERQFGKKILEYEFRAKRSIHETDYLTKLTFVDCKEIYLVEDPYIQLFLSQNCIRKSCGENCKYRNGHRPGDITIADFKGLPYVFPSLAGSKRNYSTIVTNSQKGELVAAKLSKSMEMYSCSIEDVKKHNPLFYRHTFSSKDRDEFFVDFSNNGAVAVEHWTKPAKIHKKKIVRKVYDMLPQVLRRLLWSAFHKVKK